MHVRRLDDFDVTNLPGPRNPTDPLSRRGFADGDGPAPSTGDPDPESQQELLSLPLSRRHPRRRCSRPSALGGRTLNAPQRQPSPKSRRWAHSPPNRCGGGGWGLLTPPCPSMFVALAGSELPLSTGATQAPPPPVPSNDLVLSPTIVRPWRRSWTSTRSLGPSVAARRPRWAGLSIGTAPLSPKGGTFLVHCGLLYRRGQGGADRLCIPAGGRLRARVLRACHHGPLEGHFGRAKTGPLVRRPSL